MTRRASARRYVSPFFQFALVLSVPALLLPAPVSAQSTTAAPDPGPPGQPGKPAVIDDMRTNATIDNWSLELGDAEPWFDAGPEWKPLDPRVLPGRDGRDDGSRFMLWNGGPSYAGCLVKTDYAPPPGAANGDGRVSVLVNCTIPQARAGKATGYEITVDQSRAVRILRLDADGKSTVLAESPGTSALMAGGRSYIITVGRSGARLTAKVHARGEPDPGWQVTASDATYGQGLVGVAAAGAHGRISSVTATAVAPVVVEPSNPGTPGKPAF